jgi:hypothetical protein
MKQKALLLPSSKEISLVVVEKRGVGLWIAAAHHAKTRCCNR